MSDWDSGRPAYGQHDAPRPSWPDGTTYPYPLPFPLAQAVDTDDGIWSADERQSQGDSGQPGGWGQPGDGWSPAGGRDGDEGASPLTYESDQFDRGYEADQFDATLTQPAVPLGEGYLTPPRQSYPWPPAPNPEYLAAARDTEETADSSGRGRGGRRWLLPAGVVAAGAAVGAAAVLLTGSHHPSARGTGGGSAAPATTPKMAAPEVAAATPKMTATTRAGGSRASGSASPSVSPSVSSAVAPLTVAQAKSVLAGYTTANNNANAQRSETQLATVEAGSSFAIDAGLYVTESAAGQAPYPAFAPVQATYYIPRDEPASGPRWFVVQVANAFTSNPQKVTSNEYLLFTQSAGGTWQDTAEPYLLAAANPPQIQTGTDGLATAVSLNTASVKVAPSQLPAATAASLDGAGQAAITSPGNLTDHADQQFWHGKVPGGTVTDTHAPAAGANGQEFALLTTDGGALVFYTDAAHLTISPPAGTALHITIPGLYTSQQTLTQATVGYLDQFAAYDPPATAGTAPRIVADYSGITGKN
jgi:hypothetical protein